MIKPIINNPRTPPPIPKIKVEGSDGADGDGFGDGFGDGPGDGLGVGPGDGLGVGDGLDATQSIPLISSQVILGNTLPCSFVIKHEVCEPSVLLVIHP